MENVIKINEELAVADCQLSPEQIEAAAEEGYQSILNLRSPQEEGYLPDEAEQADKAGLAYANIPVSPKNMSDELAHEVLSNIENLPKPLLSHCNSGMRSGAMAFMYIALKEGMSAEEAMEQAREMGFNCEQSPQMKDFFEQYIEEHS
jgi:uncharacterized protein (TIGR01244 family)